MAFNVKYFLINILLLIVPCIWSQTPPPSTQDIQNIFPFQSDEIVKEFDEWKVGYRNICLYQDVQMSPSANFPIEIKNEHIQLASTKPGFDNDTRTLYLPHVIKKCMGFKDYYQCLTSYFQNKITQQELMVYECCYGFEIDDKNKTGCMKKIEMKNLTDILDSDLKYLDLDKNKTMAFVQQSLPLTFFVPDEKSKEDMKKADKEDKKEDAKADEKKPEDKKEDKKPEDKKDEKKPEEKKPDDKKPEDKKADDKKPDDKKEEKNPDDKKDDEKKEDKKPDDKKKDDKKSDDKKPEDKKSDEKTSDDKDKKTKKEKRQLPNNSPPVDELKSIKRHAFRGIIPKSHLMNNMKLYSMAQEPVHVTVQWKEKDPNPIIALNCVPLKSDKKWHTKEALIQQLDGALPKVNETLFDFMIKNSNMTIVKHLMNMGLDRIAMAPDGFHTFLIPPNEAFEKLDKEIKDGLNKSEPCALETVKIHVIPDWLCPKLLEKPIQKKTLEGSEVKVDKSKIQNADIDKIQIMKNGVLIFIKDVIVSNKSISLLKRLEKEPKAKEFVEFVKQFNDSYLQNLTNQAVLIPNSEAFKKLDDKMKSKLKENKTLAEQFVKNHLMPLRFVEYMQVNDYKNPDPEYVNLSRANYMPNSFQCVRKMGREVGDFCGGKYYMLPKALVPLEKGLVDTLKEYPEVSKFTELVQKLNMTFDPNTFYTVYAPLNKAFEEMEKEQKKKVDESKPKKDGEKKDDKQEDKKDDQKDGKDKKEDKKDDKKEEKKDDKDKKDEKKDEKDKKDEKKDEKDKKDEKKDDKKDEKKEDKDSKDDKKQEKKEEKKDDKDKKDEKKDDKDKEKADDKNKTDEDKKDAEKKDKNSRRKRRQLYQPGPPAYPYYYGQEHRRPPPVTPQYHQNPPMRQYPVYPPPYNYGLQQRPDLRYQYPAYPYAYTYPQAPPTTPPRPTLSPDDLAKLMKERNEREIVFKHIFPGMLRDYCCESPDNDFFLNHKASLMFTPNGQAWPQNPDLSASAPKKVKISKCDVIAKNFLIHFVEGFFNDTVIQLEPPFPHTVSKVPFWTGLQNKITPKNK